MNRLFALILLCSVVTPFKTVYSRPWDKIQSSGTLKIATEGTFPPFNEFKGEKLTGFEVEVAEAVAKAIGIKFEWKTYPFDSLLIGLNQDRYDFVIASHGITPERLQAVDFTDPHYCTGGVIFSKAGGPLTAADLKGKSVAVQVGTTYLRHLKNIPGVKDVKTYPKDTDSLQNLLAGRVDAWITDKFVGIQGQKSNPGAHINQGEMLFQEKVAMAIAKGNNSLREKLNEGLAKILKDGTYAAISKKYFNEDIRCK
jgi:polar amino acid transport system substrate-binding protein